LLDFPSCFKKKMMINLDALWIFNNSSQLLHPQTFKFHSFTPNP
jgi:hypothetical protein